MAIMLRNCLQPYQIFRGLRAFSCSSQHTNSDKLYEMRSYVIKPKHFIDCMRLTYECIGLRTNHSKLCGFWAVELGGTLSQTIHIWEYDSYSQRTEVRKALSQDKKWQNEFVVHFMPMVLKQENVIMKAAPWYEMQKYLSTGGVYELVSCTFLPGKREQLEHRWMQGIKAHSKYSAPVGIWFNEIGPTNQVHTLMSYKNGDEREKVIKAASEDEEWAETVRDCNSFLTASETKILIPTQFSPWK
ncbi:protein NipSnap homolog 3A-like [Actinia tenebrosa]|uniref:Protein NipSnap homolog 3A-like n=1 Tax=Actinia tenebrosa TaxID=6105 RepID=A0A6P8IFR5_ACTTE|nr:protein NipSnap homolog 3A-like [Actinia tenebrosa]